MVLLKFVWVGTKFMFLFNSLKISFVNRFLFKLITCPAGSDWNPVLFSIVLRSLTKFFIVFLWSWWWWLVGLHGTQRPCSRFLIQKLCFFMHFCFRIVLLFLRLFQQFYFLFKFINFLLVFIIICHVVFWIVSRWDISLIVYLNFRAKWM